MKDNMFDKIIKQANVIIKKSAIIAQEQTKNAYDKYQKFQNRERKFIPEYVINKINNDIFLKYQKNYLKGEMLRGKCLLLETKIGGFPYLPNNMKIPKDHNDNEMRLLVQINCEDLLYLTNFPHKGLIQIYINKNVENGIKEVKTIYHNDIDYNVKIEDIYKKTLINELDNFPIRSECNLYFTKDTDTISINDKRYYNDFIKILNIENNYKSFTHKEIRKLNNNLNEKKSTKIGGNPNFNNINGDSYNEILLFQLVSDGKFVRINNDAIYTFYINEKDLLNRNFSNVKLIVSL